jgi:putative NIF3 family GTP cyclohydrolase 1 type 2
MKANQLYQRLEKDFIKPGLSDDWAKHMTKIQEFISNNFKARSMGLVCDNTNEIERVYTAVFPSDKVMREVLECGRKALLLVHHPAAWKISASGVFHQMKPTLLKQFQDREISIYNLHVPLDNYGEYGTAVTLADALGLKIIKPIVPYFGSLAGVLARTECKTTEELRELFRKVLGHRVSLYDYGSREIENGLVAVVAGGGNDLDVLNSLLKEGVHTLLTGVTLQNDYSKPAHAFARANRINILGGTHYSTERFACQAMCKYFEKLGLACEFLADKPSMKDL